MDWKTHAWPRVFRLTDDNFVVAVDVETGEESVADAGRGPRRVRVQHAGGAAVGQRSGGRRVAWRGSGAPRSHRGLRRRLASNAGGFTSSRARVRKGTRRGPATAGGIGGGAARTIGLVRGAESDLLGQQHLVGFLRGASARRQSLHRQHRRAKAASGRLRRHGIFSLTPHACEDHDAGRSDPGRSPTRSCWRAP